MAYTESKAYDLRNVQYQGTRIGGTDQISTSPIQYKDTPVPYVKYKNTNIMHRYIVWNGDGYAEEYDHDEDWFTDNEAGVYSVSSTSKSEKNILTYVTAPEPYHGNLYYDYYITKYELTRTSGTKNESKYYLYAFTIILYAADSYDRFGKFRTDKYDYLSAEDISLDTLAAQIKNGSGSTEAFTPPWKLGISTEEILKRTRRERERTDNVEYFGNFSNFTSNSSIDDGTPSSWGDEFEDSFNNSIFNQGAEDLTVDYYEYSSPSSPSTTFANGRLFNFKSVVDSKSKVDRDHVCIVDFGSESDYSSCALDSTINYNTPVIITDGFNESHSSRAFEDFSLIFLMCSSCSNSALSDGSDNLSLSYYRVDCTAIHANETYNNHIWRREY